MRYYPVCLWNYNSHVKPKLIAGKDNRKKKFLEHNFATFPKQKTPLLAQFEIFYLNVINKKDLCEYFLSL